MFKTKICYFQEWIAHYCSSSLLQEVFSEPSAAGVHSFARPWHAEQVLARPVPGQDSLRLRKGGNLAHTCTLDDVHQKVQSLWYQRLDGIKECLYDIIWSIVKLIYVNEIAHDVTALSHSNDTIMTILLNLNDLQQHYHSMLFDTKHHAKSMDKGCNNITLSIIYDMIHSILWYNTKYVYISLIIFYFHLCYCCFCELIGLFLDYHVSRTRLSLAVMVYVQIYTMCYHSLSKWFWT